ncbi:Endonuclease YncB, thermonuclease family [Methylorubrum salsuginis]|uniref:Endonuclease YncB, thermonuclease family n=1 Tax=Methylorubrum salsuginis TaxID=414703 RepID=A0A1I4FT83_9HYPH|nr:Endonuclease YncB, thermonuclease family [Methylorubrum salsuginis]
MRETGSFGVGAVVAACLAFLASAAASVEARAADSVSGKARVLNGDTLVVAGRVIGLYGVAAPGLKQTCLDGKAQSYACGTVAAKSLAAHLREATVTCRVRETDDYGRAVSVCLRDKEDLSAWLAEKGLAMADRRRGQAAYVGAETLAWGKRRGLWAGSFEDPTNRPRSAYNRSNAVADANKPETP